MYQISSKENVRSTQDELFENTYANLVSEYGFKKIDIRRVIAVSQDVIIELLDSGHAISIDGLFRLIPEHESKNEVVYGQSSFNAEISSRTKYSQDEVNRIVETYLDEFDLAYKSGIPGNFIASAYVYYNDDSQNTRFLVGSKIMKNAKTNVSIKRAVK